MNWGSAWLDRVESAGVFGVHALRRGADYARYDWQLEVDIHEGRAGVRARSGRRMVYEAEATVPVLDGDVWDDLVSEIAASTSATAALLDGELPGQIGSTVAPDPSEITLTCTCRTNDRPCKHAGALLYLLAEAFDEDPFDLLHFRGMPRAELVRRVGDRRRGHSVVDPPSGAEPQEDSGPALVWSEPEDSLPADRELPERPGRLAPFASDPPANAGFTAVGLRTLANDAAARAFELLHNGGGEALRPTTPTVDLARRASMATDREVSQHLARQSGLTTHELNARARAWEQAGATGVEAHVAPVETQRLLDLETGEIVQWRRTGDQMWVEFTKVRGRWSAKRTSLTPPDPARFTPVPADPSGNGERR